MAVVCCKQQSFFFKKSSGFRHKVVLLREIVYLDRIEN